MEYIKKEKKNLTSLYIFFIINAEKPIKKDNVVTIRHLLKEIYFHTVQDKTYPNKFMKKDQNWVYLVE